MHLADNWCLVASLGASLPAHHFAEMTCSSWAKLNATWDLALIRRLLGQTWGRRFPIQRKVRLVCTNHDRTQKYENNIQTRGFCVEFICIRTTCSVRPQQTTLPFSGRVEWSPRRIKLVRAEITGHLQSDVHLTQSMLSIKSPIDGHVPRFALDTQHNSTLTAAIDLP